MNENGTIHLWCPQCSQKNRLKYQPSVRYKCGKCGWPIKSPFTKGKTIVPNQTYSSRTYAAYLSEVEKSGILALPLRNKLPDDDRSFKASLAKSRYRAIQEFRTCHKDIVNLFEKITEIENRMSSDIKEISKKYKTYDSVWKNIFEDFNLRFSKISEYASNSLISSFDQKLKRIDRFTICLFGRTKSGKSATMEALTEGDGTSIGKGRQNTTLDVKEYQWRELLVVDTPGIDAMEKNDQLESLALSYADQADLVIFLLPHQIEEGDFDKFSRFYKQNKPILFVLNVKKEIGEKGSMEYKMFLKHSGDIFEEEKIRAYEKRINDFMLSKLDVKAGLIPVIPVHSASAFMAVKEADNEVKDKLYKCSNFQSLEEQLVKEVREYGELYRIKNPHDTVILFAKKIMNEFRLFQDVLAQEKEVFEKNIERFRGVQKKILKEKDKIISEKIESYFNSKKEAVSLLLSDLSDEEDKDERTRIMKNFVSKRTVKRSVNVAQKKIIEITEKEINEFFKTFSKDIGNMNLDSRKPEVSTNITSGIGNIEGSKDLSDLLGELSTVGSIGLAALAAFGIVNAWNPLGWALIATTGFGSWFFEEEHKKKIAEEKRNLRSKIHQSLVEAGDAISSDLDKWVNNILRDLKKKSHWRNEKIH